MEAEKFRASIAEPDAGRNFVVGNAAMCNEEEQILNLKPSGITIPNIGAGVSDDDFFHLTCHIDPNLIHKIEKGEFVELEKLLPKDKLSKSSEENRLEWVQRDGGTFLVPAQ